MEETMRGLLNKFYRRMQQNYIEAARMQLAKGNKEGAANLIDAANRWAARIKD